MKRLLKLEQDVGELKQAVLQITEVLVDQSSRMDSGFARMDAGLRAANEEAVELRRSLTERLDRLIAVTIDERTQGFGRLRELERRVERLEERVGTT